MSTQQRSTKWDNSDRAKFLELHTSGKIDISKTDPQYILRVRDKYWPGRLDKTFKLNWKTTVAQIITGEAAKGARARAQNTPETAEESDDYVSEEEEETEDIKMPPKAKKPPMSTPKVPKKHSTTEFVDNHLGGTFQGMSLTPSYTVDSYTGYQLTQYVQGNKNILEVEICFGTYIRGEDGVKIEVSDDEMNLHVTKAMHKSFADRKRRQIQLGRKYHIDDVRMVAAENTLQKIKQNEESDGQGYFFGKPQVIPLPFKVLPDILKKKFHHHPIYTHQDRLGRQHIQFHSWYTLILESAERRRVENSPTFTSTYDYMPDDPPRVDSDEEQEDNQEGFDYDDDL